MDILKPIRTIFLVLFLYGMAQAQLSPGELSKAHAFLDGIENCNKCHGFDQKLSSDKCLACHTYLGDRQKQGLGMHANPSYRKCEVCHVEHQGKDFELIFWKEGQEKFDHNLTGYILDGKHLGVKCHDCHQSKNISQDIETKEPKKNLSTTFQGLGQECATCHADEHRGQVSTKCTTCHTIAGWKPPAKFNHESAKFKLTGKHVTVACNNCHTLIVDNRSEKDKDYLKLTGISSAKCLDCHKDAHNNKFGQNCEGCHNTGSWSDIARGQFDHSKTHFALLGAHANVACEKCHAPGKPFKGLKYEKCRDCHSDYHKGQFASRPQAGACEECHTVASYLPTSFSIEAHDKTKYPLQGSHLAIPCNACHKKEMLAGNVETIKFKFENTRCLSCHKDPHKGQLDKFVTKDGCEFCHAVQSWRQTSYDHSHTKFPLEGKHKAIACRACHGKEEKEMKFVSLSLNCNECHEDIHRGQFVFEGQAKTECARCHTAADWKPGKFDHNRDTAFKLDGAHLKVACIGCHKQAVDNGKPYIKFKPLGTACSSCHSDKNIQGGKS